MAVLIKNKCEYEHDIWTIVYANAVPMPAPDTYDIEFECAAECCVQCSFCF